MTKIKKFECEFCGKTISFYYIRGVRYAIEEVSPKNYDAHTCQ